MSVIEQAVNGFLSKEKTTRVSSVYVFVSETKLLRNQQMARVFRVKEYQNTYCDRRSGINLPLAEENGRWRNLQDWVSGVSGITD